MTASWAHLKTNKTICCTADIKWAHVFLMSPWACMLTFIILKNPSGILMGMFWRGGKKGLETTRQGCLETKVSAVLSVPRGQQQAQQAQIAHAFNFSFCQPYYDALGFFPPFFRAASWKIFWLDGLFLSRNLAKTINLQRRRLGFLWLWEQTGGKTCIFRMHPNRLKAEVVKKR